MNTLPNGDDSDPYRVLGRVEAINKVEVHARVTGYLEDVLFKEGDFVKEGQVPAL